MSRADEAQRLLDEPLFIEAFSSLKDDLVLRVEVGKLDKEEEHNAVLSLQLLSRVKAYVESHIKREVNDKKITEFNLKKKKGFLRN